MSSVNREAEDGPTLDFSDEEGQDDTLSRDKPRSRDQGPVSEPAPPSDSEGGEDHSEEEDSLTINRNNIKRNGIHNAEEENLEPDGLRVTSVEPERPSSADESLSIPDDTPSIQVRISNAYRYP